MGIAALTAAEEGNREKNRVRGRLSPTGNNGKVRNQLRNRLRTRRAEVIIE